MRYIILICLLCFNSIAQVENDLELYPLPHAKDTLVVINKYDEDEQFNRETPIYTMLCILTICVTFIIVKHNQ